MTFPFAFESFLLSVLVLLAAYRRSLYFVRIFPLINVRILSFLFFFSFTASSISFEMVSAKRSCFYISEVLQRFIPAFFIIFIVFLFGVNGELIFTVEELRVSFFLNESHFRLSCCFSFFNLAIFLCNLSSLRLFLLLEASPRLGNCRDTIIGEKFLSVSAAAQLSLSLRIFSINAFLWVHDRRTLSVTASLRFFNSFFLSW